MAEASPAARGQGIEPAETASAAHHVSREQPPDPDTLAEQIREGLPVEVDHIEVAPLCPPADRFVVAIVADVDGPMRARLARAVVRSASDRAAAYPVIYAPEPWKQLQQIGADRWRELLSARGRAEQLLPLYRDLGRYPSGLRTLLERSARSYAAFVELLLGEAPLPLHLLVELTARVMRDALELLYASRQLHFDGGPRAPGLFAREFLSGGRFDADDATLYFEIEGLARRARLEHLLGLAHDRTRGEWVGLARRARDFFRAFSHDTRCRLLTVGERRRRTRWRLGGAAGVATLLAVVSGGYLLATRPLPALSDTSRLGRPGAIVGRYFRGTDLRHEVARRADPRPQLDTMDSPHPMLPADGFGIRWVGFVRFDRTGKRTICLQSDDGARLWLDHEKLIDTGWKRPTRRRVCHHVRVERGWHDLRIDYFDRSGRAQLRLSIGRSERVARPVPPRNLCCAGP